MFLEFTTIEDSNAQPEDELEFFFLPKKLERRRKFGFWEQFFYCQCGHIYYIHNFNTSKCDAEYFGKCDCTELVFTEANLEMVFTTADIFEVENPNHSERDSPQWWMEIKFWLEGINASL